MSSRLGIINNNHFFISNSPISQAIAARHEIVMGERWAGVYSLRAGQLLGGCCVDGWRMRPFSAATTMIR